MAVAVAAAKTVTACNRCCVGMCGLVWLQQTGLRYAVLLAAWLSVLCTVQQELDGWRWRSFVSTLLALCVAGGGDGSLLACRSTFRYLYERTSMHSFPVGYRIMEIESIDMCVTACYGE